MKQFIVIHLCAFTLASFPICANAFEYDVEWPTSSGPKQTSDLVITIDGCKTKVSMKNSDIEAFHNNKEVQAKFIKLAIERSKNGCK